MDLGKFNTEEEAAAAYDRASVWCLGITSRLNFPAEQQIGGVCFLSKVQTRLRNLSALQQPGTIAAVQLCPFHPFRLRLLWQNKRQIEMLTRH